eukprot:350344-Chlamydomonas_euryale.AAC.3
MRKQRVQLLTHCAAQGTAAQRHTAQERPLEAQQRSQPARRQVQLIGAPYSYSHRYTCPLAAHLCSQCAQRRVQLLELAQEDVVEAQRPRDLSADVNPTASLTVHVDLLRSHTRVTVHVTTH